MLCIPQADPRKVSMHFNFCGSKQKHTGYRSGHSQAMHLVDQPWSRQTEGLHAKQKGRMMKGNHDAAN
uniref:Uncharacterized protein n=1 Tax=Arundo donax TaxID=35708 RepID=A0A0A9F560_ARUDO